MIKKKKPLIGIIGGKGKMGNWFKTFFEKKGFKVLVSDKNTSLSNKGLAQKSDIIIVSVPIRKTAEVIREIRSFIPETALLCDITSLKVKPIEEMKKSKSGVLGMHPLFGPLTLELKKQAIVFCRVRDNQWVNFLKNTFTKEGAKVVEISPQEHDFQMALIQGLVHFLNISLARTLKSQGATLKSFLSTPSFRLQSLVMGRILGQGSCLSTDIQAENPYFKEILGTFLKEAKNLAMDLNSKNYKNFDKKLRDSTIYFKDVIKNTENLSKSFPEFFQNLNNPRKKTNIVLIGYRGVGKTTIGKALSQKLKMPLLSIDKEIVKKAELPVTEIVEKYGWEKFRQLEREIVKKASFLENLVIDPGGGVILKKENINNLRNGGVVFWLKADVETIIQRLKQDYQRPSLTGSKSFIEEIPQVLKEREPKYLEAADYIIDAQTSTSEQVSEIIKYLKENG